jgi:hypothetical protein
VIESLLEVLQLNEAGVPRTQYHGTTKARAERISRTGIQLPRGSQDVATFAHSTIPSISTADEARWASSYGDTLVELRVKRGAKYLKRSYPRSARKGETLQQAVSRWMEDAKAKGYDGVHVGPGIQGSAGNQTLNPRVLEFVRIVD